METGTLKSHIAEAGVTKMKCFTGNLSLRCKWNSNGAMDVVLLLNSFCWYPSRIYIDISSLSEYFLLQHYLCTADETIHHTMHFAVSLSQTSVRTEYVFSVSDSLHLFPAGIYTKWKSQKCFRNKQCRRWSLILFWRKFPSYGFSPKLSAMAKAVAKRA